MQYAFRGNRKIVGFLAAGALAALLALALGTGAAARTRAHAKHKARTSSATISSIPWGNVGARRYGSRR